MKKSEIDPGTRRAVRAFLTEVRKRYDVAGVILFGGRARGDFHEESDADLAVVLRGHRGRSRRLRVVGEMGGMTFDVLMDTGVFIQPVPIWEDEWRHPEKFSNPELLENIRRDGVQL